MMQLFDFLQQYSDYFIIGFIITDEHYYASHGN